MYKQEAGVNEPCTRKGNIDHITLQHMKHGTLQYMMHGPLQVIQSYRVTALQQAVECTVIMAGYENEP